MDYNKLLQKLKQKYFPELKDRAIILKKRNQKNFMTAYPLNNYIYYNETIMKKCNPAARDAALIHELYHKLQFGRMNFLKQALIRILYKRFQKIRIKIEREAHIETVKRGFGKGTILLNAYVKQRVPPEVWKNESGKLHLSDKEIRKLMAKDF